MAIELDNRTKILAGVAVLAVAGAGAWFFLFEEEPPPPPKVAAKAPAKPAAAKAPEAAKPAAPVKPAAAAKPIPTDPDKMIAEIIETSGMTKAIRNFAAEVAANAVNASRAGQEGAEPPDPRLIQGIAQRHFDPAALLEDLANGVKTAYEADRMGRFLELLRQPVALKMTQLEGRALTQEEKARFAEELKKNPPAPARQKLVQTLDEVSRTSEIGAQITTLAARETVDAMFEALHKAGRRPPKEARQAVNAQINAAEPQLRNAFRTLLFLTYRDASDAELAEYVKLMDSETGRWGNQVLVNAFRGAVEKRLRPFAHDMAQLAVAQLLAAKPAAKAPVEPAAPAAAEKPAAPPVAAAPAEPPGYRRPAGIRELYTRYNDLVTAVVMRDRAAVRELLADGKSPNARQSDGLTALMVAAGNGDAETAELLLARGADPNLRAPGGTSALAMAKESRNPAVVTLLERHGAKN